MRDVVRRLRDHDEEGLSLVEIMVAAFILTVALLALASTATASLISLSTSLGRQEATDAASAVLENLRRSNFSEVALNATEVQAAGLGTCDDRYREPIVTDPRPDAMPHRQLFGERERIEITTIVTWYRPEGDAAGDCAVTRYDVKRVRVEARWVDRGRTFTIEESTLVSSVDRGLPAPDFQVAPATTQVNYHESNIDPTNADENRERCVPQTIWNFGATDEYEWHVERLTGGAPISNKRSIAEYELHDGRWVVRAFMEFPAKEEPVNPETQPIQGGVITRWNPNEAEAQVELLVDHNSTGWPESVARLAAGDQARLWVCYRPGKLRDNYSVYNPDQDATQSRWLFNVMVRSQLDPSRYESVVHDLRIVKESRRLFLFDSDDQVPGGEPIHHPRVPDGSTTLPVLTMGPDVGVEPGTLGTTSGLPNYDTDFTSLSGMRLKDGPRLSFPGEGSWSASTVRFHYQVTEELGRSTTFGPTVQLQLYSLAESMWNTTVDGETEFPELTYNVQLEVLSESEQSLEPQLIVLDGSTDGLYSYTHNQTGWMPQLVTFDLGDEFVVQNGQYLRLSITCSAPDEDACHIAFDHVNFASYLLLDVVS